MGGVLPVEFIILPHRIDGRNEHNTNACTSGVESFIFLCRYIACFEQQFQPIFCLICFFEGDLQFGNKIGLAMGILRFTDISTDRCAALPI